jgi:filamin
MAEDYKPPQDTRWIDIQKRTFTRWANNFLLERMMKIEDLGTDLSDGLLLINLLEIISSKAIPAYNKKPKIRAHKLENTGTSLQFLKNEGIKLVAIGPEDITDCNLKLILGLIWTIILRYQIQKSSAGGSAKNDLLEWVRRKIPECNVNDFTNSWADGRAVCHLVEALNPGSFPPGGLNDLKGKSPLDNATKGEGLAESDLGIPQILAPEDMVAAADELSCMTYISYFRDYENNEGKRRAAELAAKTADPSKTKAWGPGLEGAQTYTPTEFYIQAVNAAGVNIPVGGENFKVTISGPSGTSNPPVVDNGNGTYTVKYQLNEPGPHQIQVDLKTQRGAGPWAPIQGSPWTVNVTPTADPANTTVTDVVVTVRARNHQGQPMTRGGEKFTMTITPNIPVKFVDNQDGTYTGSYTPATSGTYKISIQVGGKDIKGSPWTEQH